MKVTIAGASFIIASSGFAVACNVSVGYIQSEVSMFMSGGCFVLGILLFTISAFQNDKKILTPNSKTQNQNEEKQS